MKNLTNDQKILAEVHGTAEALRVGFSAFIASMPEEQRPLFAANLEKLAEHQKAQLLGSAVPEELFQSFVAALDSIRSLAALR